MQDHSRRLRQIWALLARLPGGKWLFSRLIGRAAPYTGTLPFVVEALEPGFARVRMRDVRGVRNHLNSIHAMALANLGEVATGLALNFGLSAGRRAILVGYEMRYLKKARGRLTASCQVDMPPPDGEVVLDGRISDEGGNIVAEARAVWKVGAAR